MINFKRNLELLVGPLKDYQGDGNSQQSEADNSSIKAGDKVRVLVNATYDGGSFIMYYDTYDVLEVNGDRAVIGIGDTVTCAINTCNIERV